MNLPAGIDNIEDFLFFLCEEVKKKKEKSVWIRIVEAIGHLLVLDSGSLYNICALLVDALLTAPCEDCRIVVALVELCARYLHVTCGRVVMAPPQTVFLDVNCRFETVCRRRLVIEANPGDIGWVLGPVRNAKGYAAKYIGPGFDRIASWTPGSEGAEWVALNAGDSRFLEVIVRYGLWNGPLDGRGLTHWMDFLRLCVYLRENVLPPQEEEVPDYAVTENLWTTLQEPGYKTSSGNLRGFKRVPLIVRTLKALVLYGQGDRRAAEQYMRCLSVSFAALPDPFVSADEVRDFLLLMTRSGGAEAVDGMVNEWTGVFGPQPYSPRSLKHLSRCAVRSFLMEKKPGVLPALVEPLPIPRPLKNFVLGDPESRWK